MKSTLALLFASSIFVSARPLNIIAIVTDDQSAWSVSCYGGKNLETPALDQLANEGARFTNAFVNSPVCSPSRFTYLTGRWPSEAGVTDYLSGPQAKRLGISDKFPSWPAILKQNGYDTALIGKWHIGSKPDSQPGANGFDHFDGNLAGGWAPKNPRFQINDGKPRKIEGHSVEIVTDLAINVLKQKRDQPLALLVHYREPHAAYVPMPDEDMAATADMDPTIPAYPGLPEKKVKGLMRDYLTAVRAIDRNVGRILKALEAGGLAEDTIVLFTSDHGYNMGHHGLRFKGNGYWLAKGKKGCRPNMFDTSMQVPLIVRWPGTVKAGTTIDAHTSNIDTLPSVLGMLGVKEPDGLVHHGRDFSPWLRGESPDAWPNAVFGQYSMVNNAKDSMRCIRTSKWKLIRHYRVDGKDELYDLENDPGETTNLFDNPEYASARAKLQAQLDEWMESIDDDPTALSPQAKR